MPSAEIWGRRPTILIASAIFVIGAALQVVGNLPCFYIGRFLTGIGVGPMTVVCPLYISETAPNKLRGRFIGTFEIMYQFGGLLGFWVNYGVAQHLSGTNPTQWRVPVSLQIPLIGVFGLGCILLPETPRWMAKKDRTERALSILSRLRGLDRTHDYVQREMFDITTEIRIERAALGVEVNSSAWFRCKKRVAECVSPAMRHRISVGIICQIIGQLSGINGINYYSPRIFQSLGVVGTNTALFATGIYGVVKTIAAIVAYFFIVDRLGRRTLLLAGAIIMAFSLWFIGGYIKLAPPIVPATGEQSSISSGGIAACAFIYIYVIGFVSSFAGVSFILSSECVPLNIRAISATLGAATQWLFNLVITKATPYMITSMGFGTFFFFGSFTVLGGIYVWFFVPETKGVPLEHMAKVFGKDDLVESERRFVELTRQATVGGSLSDQGSLNKDKNVKTKEIEQA